MGWVVYSNVCAFFISVPCYAGEKVEQKRECFRFSVPYQMLFMLTRHTHTHTLHRWLHNVSLYKTKARSSRRCRLHVHRWSILKESWKFFLLIVIDETHMSENRFATWLKITIHSYLAYHRSEHLAPAVTVVQLSTYSLYFFFFFLIWALADGMCFYNWLVPTKCWLRSLLTISGPPGVTGHQYWTGISSMDLLLDC